MSSDISTAFFYSPVSPPSVHTSTMHPSSASSNPILGILLNITIVYFQTCTLDYSRFISSRPHSLLAGNIHPLPEPSRQTSHRHPELCFCRTSHNRRVCVNDYFSFNSTCHPPVLDIYRTSREVVLSILEPAFTRTISLHRHIFISLTILPISLSDPGRL